jgi:hypothetical protein
MQFVSSFAKHAFCDTLLYLDSINLYEIKMTSDKKFHQNSPSSS